MVGVGEAVVPRQALADDLLGRAAVQHALAAGVVGLVEAGQQSLEVAVAGDGDAEHLALDPAVEALDHAVGARRVGPGLAVLDAELPAELLEAVGGETAAAVGQQERAPEREGGECLPQERGGAGLGLVVPDRQVHGARAAVDGHEQEALAQLAITRPQLGQVLHVHVDEAELVLLELARGRLGLGRGRPPAQPRRLEDAVDVVAAEVRQGVPDHEGEVVRREAGRATQLAHHGALLPARLPGQLARPAGAVAALRRPALAPLADGLGADAAAPGRLAGGLARAGDPGPHGRGGAGVGVDREHRAVPPARGARSRPSKRQAYAPGRSGGREVSLRTGAVLVVGRAVAWRTPVAQAGRPFLLDHVAALEDPRQRAKVLHPLPEVLPLLPCATLAGAGDVVEIALWGDERLALLRRFLPCEHGVPSHDTPGAAIAALDPGLFEACFAAWVEGLRETEPDLVAIDGETSRRSHARSEGRGPSHLVSARATRQRLVLGREAVGGKSNGITAIPLLLERPALEGALVTIDAIGAQGALAEVILRRGGDYLPALKANRPATLKDVAAFLAEPPPGAVDTFEAADGDHGRIAIRRHAVCHDVAWLFSDRRYPGEVAFPGLAMIGMVEGTTERGGETSRERRHYLGSARLDAATFARAVRGHWGIENRPRWILDVVFRGDLARLRTGHAPENMAVVRHAAVNLPGRAAPSVSLKNRRKRAGWNTAYLETLIRQTA